MAESQKMLEAFAFDRIAEVDALVTWLLGHIKTASSFTDLQIKLQEELKEVKITQAIDIDEWLREQQAGYVMVTKYYPDNTYDLESDTQQYTVDYYREDDGMPVLFKSYGDALIALPKGHAVVRVINCAADYAQRLEREGN